MLQQSAMYRGQKNTQKWVSILICLKTFYFFPLWNENKKCWHYFQPLQKMQRQYFVLITFNSKTFIFNNCNIFIFITSRQGLDYNLKKQFLSGWKFQHKDNLARPRLTCSLQCQNKFKIRQRWRDIYRKSGTPER